MTTIVICNYCGSYRMLPLTGKKRLVFNFPKDWYVIEVDEPEGVKFSACSAECDKKLRERFDADSK